MNIHTALQQGQAVLKSNSDVALLEATILLSHVLRVDRSYLYTHPETILSADTLSAYQKLLAQRATGIPIAYLIGTQEFWSLELEVNAATLVPRPETEILVEATLNLFPADAICKIADLGTGSGAIALALATERPHWQLHAVDRELLALEVAKRNAITLGINNITFYEGDWCAPLIENTFDAIVSNPPYLAENDPYLSALTYEPITALVSGEDGLTAIRKIIIEARRYLKTKGWLVLEHGYNQKNSVANLLEEHHYNSITSVTDLAGHPRVAIARR